MQSAGRGAMRKKTRLEYEKSIWAVYYFFFDAIKMQLVFDGFLQVLHRPGLEKMMMMRKVPQLITMSLVHHLMPLKGMVSSLVIRGHFAPRSKVRSYGQCVI